MLCLHSKFPSWLLLLVFYFPRTMVETRSTSDQLCPYDTWSIVFRPRKHNGLGFSRRKVVPMPWLVENMTGLTWHQLRQADGLRKIYLECFWFKIRILFLCIIHFLIKATPGPVFGLLTLICFWISCDDSPRSISHRNIVSVTITKPLGFRSSKLSRLNKSSVGLS